MCKTMPMLWGEYLADNIMPLKNYNVSKYAGKIQSW